MKEKLLFLIQRPQFQFFCLLLLFIIFFLEFIRSQSFTSTIFIWSGILCYNKYNTCVRQAGAKTKKETLQAITGFFIDLNETSLTFETPINALKVGDEVKFTITQNNAYGNHFTTLIPEGNEGGWQVNITGTTRIIPDFQSMGNGVLQYTCTMRKTGNYKIDISFRGIPFKTPIEVFMRSGDIDARQCKVKGLSSGCFPVSTEDIVSVTVLSYDSLGNTREEGGLSDSFSLLYKEVTSKNEWKEILAETQDNYDGSYEIFFEIKQIGLFEVKVKFDGIEIAPTLTICILNGEMLRQIRSFIKKKRASFKVIMPEFPKTSIKLNVNQSQLSFRVYKCLNLIRWKKIETLKMARTIYIQPDEDYSGLHIHNPSYMQNIHCIPEEGTTHLIIGTIFAFLHIRHAGTNTGRFEERRKLFYTEIIKSHNKLLSSAPHTHLPSVVLQVDRNNILESTYRRISKSSSSSSSKFWRSPWRVIFIGERGIDEGGLRRELLTILARELFDINAGWKLFERLCEEMENIHPSTRFNEPEKKPKKPKITSLFGSGSGIHFAPSLSGNFMSNSGNLNNILSTTASFLQNSSSNNNNTNSSSGSGGGSGSNNNSGTNTSGNITTTGNNNSSNNNSSNSTSNNSSSSNNNNTSMMTSSGSYNTLGLVGGGSGSTLNLNNNNNSGNALYNNQISSKILQKYEFAGKVIAKCVYDTIVADPCLVNVHFSTSFYKQLLDLPIHYSDFAIDDPQYYTSKIKFIIENNIDDAYLDMFFVEEEVLEDMNGVKYCREYELKPNGANIEVTEENKKEFLLLLSNFRLALKVHKQIQAFAKGFYSILPRKLINIFDEKELELLICGLPKLDVAQMKKYTFYEGFSASHPEIEWFWSTVENFTEEEKAKLIQFITGSSQVPVEGFSAFQPRITIGRSYAPRGNLPQAHTCFNKIDLPEYESCSDLAKKLLIAITEGVEGFGFG